MEQTMSEKDNPLLNTVLGMINDRMDSFEGLVRDSKKDTDVQLKSILTQVKRTNGRVTKLEQAKATEKAAKTAKKLNLPPPNVIYLVALGTVILLVIIAALLKVPLGGILG